MSETSIITIILSLFAVSGTLGGTWLGRLLERRNETRRWRRERCLEIYTEVFSACDIVVNNADDAYIMECESLAHNKQSEIIIKRVAEMYRTVDKTVLLAPQEVYTKLLELTSYCGREIGARSMECPKLSKSEWDKMRIIDYAKLYFECLIAARNDLGVFPRLYSIAKLQKSIVELKEEMSKGNLSLEEVELRIKEIELELKSTKRSEK